MSKYEHVRNAPDDQPGHTCHATGCREHAKAAYVMCFAHWRKVPIQLQRQIWAHYRPGQERAGDKSPSLLYVESLLAAILAVEQEEKRMQPTPQAQRPWLILLAHPKSTDDVNLVAFKSAFLAFAQREGLTVHAVLGREDFDMNFRLAGSWNAWSRSIADRYDAMVVPGEGSVGRATADSAAAMLAAGKKVLWWRQDGTFVPCSQVFKTSGRAVDGWMVAP